MYAFECLIPLSALQHYCYCPRQCAFIHLEMVWTENVFTAEGRLMHAKADSGEVEVRGNVKIVTGLLLRSLEYGLTGKTDVVEFYQRENVWHPYPVEYKRGWPKKHNADRVQLCAQALCLEEMLGVNIPEGALFYGKTRRRQTVIFDTALRLRIGETATATHALLERRTLPPPANDERCAQCSLLEQCRPQVTATPARASRYLESLRGKA